MLPSRAGPIPHTSPTLLVGVAAAVRAAVIAHAMQTGSARRGTRGAVGTDAATEGKREGVACPDCWHQQR
jgi:hypothetical protein